MDATRNRAAGGAGFGGATGRGQGSSGSGAFDIQVQALYQAMRAHVAQHAPLSLADDAAALHRPTLETLTLLVHSAQHSSSLAFVQTFWPELTARPVRSLQQCH